MESNRIRSKYRVGLKTIASCGLMTFFVLFADLAYSQHAEGVESGSGLSDPDSSQSHHSSQPENYFDDKGFRSHRYRAPLPDTVPGGKVVRADEIRAIIDQYNPALIDVLAVTLRPEAIDFGISWLPDSPRLNIPGSVWLPNVGRADLEPYMLRFFSDHLVELTDGKLDNPILFYCIADCWMSWNASKRAAEWGYSNVYWFPEGTDGWEASGGELVETEPESIIEYIEEAEIQ